MEAEDQKKTFLEVLKDNLKTIIIVFLLLFSIFSIFSFMKYDGKIKKQNLSEDFIKVVLDNIIEKNISVVPTSPPIAKFIKRHRRYKKMLPVGIRI